MFSLKKISVLICMLFSISLFNSVDAYDRFAKVVVIGLTGSGKTVLYNLLTYSDKSINETEHDTQISTAKVEYNIDGKSICIYFGDTSGEPNHSELMESFCHNANVVLITLDAVDLLRSKLRPMYLPESGKLSLPEDMKNKKDAALDHLENLISNLYKYAPNCRVVVVLTKMEQVDRIFENEDNKKWKKSKKEIENYVSEIKEMFDGSDENGEVDETYNLTLYNPNNEFILAELKKTKEQVVQETKEHRVKLENIIKGCLRKYGLQNLPLDPDGFRAEVVKSYEFEESCTGTKKVVKEYDKLNVK